MAKKYKNYWYQTNTDVQRAFLYNCRDHDLCHGNGISVGSIVRGAVGFVIAESFVPDLTGSIVSFCPIRRCEWMGFTLPCMTEAPLTASERELRPFNYVVAELAEIAALDQAQSAGVPVVPYIGGKRLVNLEIFTFERQGRKNPRRAKLL